MDTQLDKTACYKSKISYDELNDLIYIEHFSQHGKLLSKVRMDFEDAYYYAKMLLDVADRALGVD